MTKHRTLTTSTAASTPRTEHRPDTSPTLDAAHAAGLLLPATPRIAALANLFAQQNYKPNNNAH